MDDRGGTSSEARFPADRMAARTRVPAVLRGPLEQQRAYHRPIAARLLPGSLVGPLEASDVVQETFLTTGRNLDQFEGTDTGNGGARRGDPTSLGLEPRGKSAGVQGLAFAPDGLALAGAFHDGTIGLWMPADATARDGSYPRTRGTVSP